MRIKNECIKINNGKSTTTLRNYIYDEYLSVFSKTQYLTDLTDIRLEQRKKVLEYVYIKFDEPLEDITNATINDFEISSYKNKINVEAVENVVRITYEYNLDNGYKIEDDTLINIEDYYGRKITALGFGVDSNVFACLDVSNYDIYIYEDEGIYITRKDIIATEAECYGYDYPIHLIPTGDIQNAEYNSVSGEYEPLYANLYSIGLSKTKGILDEEYIIGQDIDIKIESDTSFGFNLLKGENETIYPQENLYTSESMYPLPPYSRSELYPKDTLFPKNDLFPKDSNFKFIFYKFRLYTIHWNGTSPSVGNLEIKYLDKYYTMYLKNNTTGLFEIITKIERSDD